MSEAATVSAGGPAGSIHVRGLRHVYKGGTVALDGVDLDIGVGLFGLLGPNGAGKSTFMRILCTLLVPTEGKAVVDGCDVIENRGAVRARLGYLPQEFGGWRLQKVGEVLDILARISGIKDKALRKQRVESALADVGLSDVAKRKVKKLSGGMVRRLGVAQALIHDPKILVVDEPTVGLDPEERLRFRQLMASLGQERVIVLSTHIVADLGAGCNDLAIIDNGKIVFRGRPAELVAQAKGRVFETLVGAGGEAGLGEQIEIVSRKPEGVGFRIRAVSRGAGLPAGASVVENPTLEESYLAFMASRGRADAALSEEEA